MIDSRVEQHKIKRSNTYFNMLRNFCHLSKNLYNQANYIMREALFKGDCLPNYYALDEICKQNIEYPDYRNMPTAQCAQQTLKLLSQTWKAYLHALKNWKKHSEKYLGKPKPPKYLKQSGYQVLILTNQNCKLKGNTITFPRVFNGFTIPFQACKKQNFKRFQQVRIVPGKYNITIEIVYEIEIPDVKVQDTSRCISIDIGVDNLAAVANNFHGPAILINGRPLKSMNQYYNKQLSKFKSELMKVYPDRYSSNRILRLIDKRNAKIKDYLHKASRKVINYCLKYKVKTIVIGKNKNWKQQINIGKTNNQNFVGIPFNIFIAMISYKAKEYGISVRITEESYTSGTSFIDNEEPIEDNYNKIRRIKRGMFRSNIGLEINADLNAAYQIMKKVIPIKWDRGCVLQPVMLYV